MLPWPASVKERSQANASRRRMTPATSKLRSMRDEGRVPLRVPPSRHLRSVWRSVLMRVAPGPVGSKDRPDVVVGIVHLVTVTAVSDFQIDRFPMRPVDEVVRRTAGGKTEAHAWMQVLLAVLGHEDEIPLDDIHEFILPAVAVKQRGGAARRQCRQIHSEIAKAEEIAKRALDAPSHELCECLWIGCRPGAGRGRFGDDSAVHSYLHDHRCNTCRANARNDARFSTSTCRRLPCGARHPRGEENSRQIVGRQALFTKR